MQKVASEIEECKVCKQEKSGKAVVGEGSLEAEIVFIGEAPGKNEAIVGRPFIGRSGKLLRSMITGIGLKESEVYITSPVKYLPDRGTPTSEDIAHGRIHLMKQFEIIKPKLVVLLGRVAAEGVLGKKVFVVKEHGEIIEEKDGIKYFLTLHPAAVLRFPGKYKLEFEKDFKKLKDLSS
ncbi:MAG: uracil-DNA glycosylase [Candidatus Levybacteria bacterium]|nr:uracil-DNA glycosylase [Candidatus Levybacteria bacterium]